MLVFGLQLLALTIQQEKPELESEKTRLLQQEEDKKIQLAQLEESLLEVHMHHSVTSPVDLSTDVPLYCFCLLHSSERVHQRVQFWKVTPCNVTKGTDAFYWVTGELDFTVAASLFCLSGSAFCFSRRL